MNRNILHEGWELRCEAQFLTQNKNKERAYICSPLRAADDGLVRQNMNTAKAYMYYASTVLGVAACAPHAYLPFFLCDEKTEDRALALHFGLKLLATSSVVLVCGERISSGMIDEIVLAARLLIPIHVFNETVYAETQKILVKEGLLRSSITLDLKYPSLGAADPVETDVRLRFRSTRKAKEEMYVMSV